MYTAAHAKTPAAPPTTHTHTLSNNTKILVVGDSISAEYGLKRGTGWVQLLYAKLKKQHPNATIVNASISGDTSASGRYRLPVLLKKHNPSLVILALGANDALRGLSLKATLNNLTAMSKASQKTGAHVLITGMQMPPNYGKAYQMQFRKVFERAAKQTNAALLPFLLTGVADIEAEKSLTLFQKDRIHPNEQAQQRIMENVWNSIQNTKKIGNISHISYFLANIG